MDQLRGNAGKRKPEKQRKATQAALDAPAPEPPPVPSPPPVPDLPPELANLPADFHPPASMTGAARQIWLEDIDTLRSSRLFRHSDLQTFEVWCNTKARYRQALAVTTEKGLTYESRSKHGTFTRIRPEVKIIEACERSLARLSEQLALSTSSRTRLNASARQLGLPLDGPEPEKPPASQGAAPSPTAGPASPAATTDNLDVFLRDRPGSPAAVH